MEEKWFYKMRAKMLVSLQKQYSAVTTISQDITEHRVYEQRVCYNNGKNTVILCVMQREPEMVTIYTLVK